LPPIGLAAGLPVARARWAHFTTLATLTLGVTDFYGDARSYSRRPAG
jgi:hypothetical protein